MIRILTAAALATTALTGAAHANIVLSPGQIAQIEHDQQDQDIIRAIDIALKKKRLSDAAASKLAVGNPSLIKNLRNSRKERERAHPLENLQALAEVLDLDFYFGPPRQPADAPTIDPTDNLDYALVAAYPVEASAGPGATAVDVASDGALAFRKEWLSRRGISVDNAALLRARGDSMQPVIWHGDLVMIDRSRTVPRVRDPKAVSLRKGYQDDIYVVELEGSLLVKALRRPSEHRLIIFSENTAHYDPVELRDEEINALRVIGKAVWWGHSAE